MGNVSGRIEEAPALYLRDQTRLSIAALHVTNAQKRTLLKLVPNGYPCTKITAKKEAGDDGLIEYVQDPDSSSPGPAFLLKFVNEDELQFHFTFNIRKRQDTGANAADTVINGLTFVLAQNAKGLESLITREFHADPNLHKNPNVNLVGDFSTDGSSAVQFQWTWTWRPPTGFEERGNNGWRTACSFVEYDQRAHRLTTLASFSFWVQSALRPPWPPSPMHGFEITAPPKLRLNSVSEGYRSDKADYLEPGSPTDTSHDPVLSVKVDCQRPPESMMADDGPLFRATIKSLEQKTGAFRNKIKKVLKRAEAAKLAQSACNEAVEAFRHALKDAANSNASGIQPALDHYFERTYREIQKYEKQNEENLQKLVIDPLTKLYNSDIKQAEAKKKDFEEESRDYYNFVSRYLGMRNDTLKQKKKVESDSKYQIKRKNFELKRFDYCSFMEDLHGGRKEQEVLSQLTKFADAQARSFLASAKKVQEMMPQLEALSREVKETDKEFQLQRTEREERRRQLEKSQKTYIEPENVPSFAPPPTTPNLSSGQFDNATGVSPGNRSDMNTSQKNASAGTKPQDPSGYQTGNAGLSSPPSGITNSSPAPANKFRGIRDLQEKDYSAGSEPLEYERKKEGLLWALSRPGSHVDPKGLNKQAWHKYWVVLAGGQLCEYSNWKQKLDLHNEPINLRMASVREARSSERRFCFEVITPQYKRVYQATSEEDMNSWIAAINNALKSTIEGGASVTNFDASRIENDVAQTKNIQSVLIGRHHNSSHSSSLSNSGSNNSLYRRTTVGARPNPARRGSTAFGDDPEKLLQLVREADVSNSSCADCGSQIKTEWVSINLGIVLCIECSGLHRSLGTHISKVRSLTLDTTSFTPDLVDLICQIGNRVSNNIWEAKLNLTQKPDHRASRETRLKFITAKYAERAWVASLSPTLSLYASPDETLLEAVKKNDLAGALYALALHASANTRDPSTGIHVAYLALQAADPVPTSSLIAPVSPVAELNPSTGGINPPTVTFPLAELILQNGGEMPLNVPNIPLSHWAKQYVAMKTAKQQAALGSSAIAGGPLGTPKSGYGVGISSSSNQNGSPADSSPQERDREIKLQKRVSSGGRIDRSRPLDRS